MSNSLSKVPCMNGVDPPPCYGSVPFVPIEPLGEHIWLQPCNVAFLSLHAMHDSPQVWRQRSLFKACIIAGEVLVYFPGVVFRFGDTHSMSKPRNQETFLISTWYRSLRFCWHPPEDDLNEFIYSEWLLLVRYLSLLDWRGAYHCGDNNYTFLSLH